MLEMLNATYTPFETNSLKSGDRNGTDDTKYPKCYELWTMGSRVKGSKAQLQEVDSGKETPLQ